MDSQRPAGSSPSPLHRTDRAGVFEPQPGGYQAFLPHPLPPADPPIDLDRLAPLLSPADLALGRLDGLLEFVPEPELFVRAFTRKEAVESTRIEGSQATLADMLRADAASSARRTPTKPPSPTTGPLGEDLDEVRAAIEAMEFGVAALGSRRLDLDLICDIHRRLMATGRGSTKHPGRLRDEQNWIGPKQSTLRIATFVPPPPERVPTLMDNLLRYAQHDPDTPSLIRCGVVHAQFETIHPFFDGNGRLGRLLITLMLCDANALRRPLLFLSDFLRDNRREYIDRLNAVRTHGDWEGWLEFFLRGVAIVATTAHNTARSIEQLRRELADQVDERISGAANANARRLLDMLFRQPIIDAAYVIDRLDVARATAYSVIDRLEALGVLEPIDGPGRGQSYRFTRYLELLEPEAD
jgi:Fic family protein